MPDEKNPLQKTPEELLDYKNVSVGCSVAEPMHPNPLMRKSVGVRAMNPKRLVSFSAYEDIGFGIPNPELLVKVPENKQPVYAMPPEHRGDDDDEG